MSPLPLRLSRHHWSLLVLAGVFAIVLFAVWYGGRQPPPAGEALAPGGDFTLLSADGPVALTDLRGQVVLIYFGYASCPDACPTTLAQIAQGLAMLSASERARVRVLFVSVDPVRDTPEKLKTYAAHFAPEVIGLTGRTPSELAEIAARYGAYFRYQKVESAVGYVVDHTSFTSLVGPDGRLRERLPHGTPPAEIAAAVRRALPKR